MLAYLLPDINIQFFNQRMHFFIFVFLFNSPYISFGCDPAIISGTLISSLHCSLVHLVLPQNRYTEISTLGNDRDRWQALVNVAMNLQVP